MCLADGALRYSQELCASSRSYCHHLRPGSLIPYRVLLCRSQAQCGIPALQSCIGRLLWQCNQVFFNQLSAWWVILVGVLRIHERSLIVKR